MNNSSKEFTNFILNAILFFLCVEYSFHTKQEQTILFLELNVIYHIYYSFTL
jgi:hypothetical protein